MFIVHEVKMLIFLFYIEFIINGKVITAGTKFVEYFVLLFI